jgi:hypothetical protein
MNTRIHYLYRDGSNNKPDDEVVLTGTFTSTQVATMRAICDAHQYFIPGDVGLPDIQTYWRDHGYAYLPDHDHIWCEFFDPEPTHAAPTLDVTADALYERWVAIKAWDVPQAMQRLGFDPVSSETASVDEPDPFCATHV